MFEVSALSNFAYMILMNALILRIAMTQESSLQAESAGYFGFGVSYQWMNHFDLLNWNIVSK